MQTYLTSNKQSSDLTDDALVQQAQIGDQGAFEILVNRYSALLYFLICGMVRDEHLAHDVLQRVSSNCTARYPHWYRGGRSRHG